MRRWLGSFKYVRSMRTLGATDGGIHIDLCWCRARNFKPMHFYPDVMNRTLVTERPDIYIAGHRSTRQAYFSNDTCKRLARGPAMIFRREMMQQRCLSHDYAVAKLQ